MYTIKKRALFILIAVVSIFLQSRVLKSCFQAFKRFVPRRGCYKESILRVTSSVKLRNAFSDHFTALSSYFYTISIKNCTNPDAEWHYIIYRYDMASG
ncbi:hypothetical protein FLACOL7796_04011 [Flavobacterium collinsii]|uniref:Uncharacterized protein n=1 Tax=Flavobacterium collinsii TaxID=1114861 RepID=A0ABN7EQT9_9FLAO|nr:hypothetical protein FLACOL7796_04011 [Flavobacterium collinsii]